MSVVFYLLFILFLIVYIYKYCTTRTEGFPPGPIRLPIWGSYWFMLKENYKFSHQSLISLARKHKTDILGLYLGSFPTVVTFSQKLCKEMLGREEFIGRPDTILTRARALDKRLGIFFVDGWFWRDQRRFSLRNMRDFGFGRRSEVLENVLNEEIGKVLDLFSNGPKGEDDHDVCIERGRVLFPNVFYGPFLNAIFWVLASTRFEHHNLRQIAQHLIASQRVGDMTGCAITFTPWLRHIAPEFFGYSEFVKHVSPLLNFLKEIVEEHQRTFSSDLCRDFIDVYINELEEVKPKYGDVSSFSEDQMLLTILDYMFPSAIAQSHTLHFYFAQLLNHPDVQDKIHEEIDDVVGRGRLPTLNDRQHMPYTEASIREVIRTNPINPIGLPRVCVKDCELGGYFIPKNTLMFACVESAHFDETVWKDPRKYSPERWLQPNGELSKRDETLGFGAGKRLCAGETFSRQNMFLMVTALLQNFKLRAIGKPPDMEKQIPGQNVSLPDYWIEAAPRVE